MGSPDGVHLLKYASLVLGLLPKVYVLEGEDTNVIGCPYEGDPQKRVFAFITLISSHEWMKLKSDLSFEKTRKLSRGCGFMST